MGNSLMVSTDPEDRAREREEKRQNGGGLVSQFLGSKMGTFASSNNNFRNR